eukprot:CAMPEP_0202917774 /NCGR_PEP_ID=MMETSP1392-20130828/71798_1 /ASSEMBLY_ACC=CAM_ASM_000868 /TAXON_ID=225041 /ORGANISM="Chlamydomonas chlamydogama, Strain SAG 11-48b" /LENGTH=45 /DNA_ID= /DNA_START= /DNA_END= /DNA_ORIENTATION=
MCHIVHTAQMRAQAPPYSRALTLQGSIWHVLHPQGKRYDSITMQS